MPQVVIDDGAPKKQTRLAGAIIAVALLLVIMGGVIFLKSQTPPTKDETKSVLLKAQDRSFSGNYDTAIAGLQSQLKTAKTNEEKVSLYVSIGSNYEAKGDFQTALSSYLAASKVMETYGTDLSVARVEEKLGKKTEAIDYYKRCVKMIRDGTAKHHAGELPELQQNISRLGGTS